MRSATPKNYQMSYDQYKGELDIQNVSGELARCRTLAEEVNDSIQANSKGQAEIFFQLVFDMLADNEDEETCHRILKILKEAYFAVFQPLSRITIKEAECMLKILKTSAEIAEKYRKIQEQMALNVSYDEAVQNLFIKFMVQVVIPYVPVDSRGDVALRMRAFIPMLSEESLRA